MVRDDIGPDGTGRGRDGMGRYDAKRQGKYRKGEIKLFQAAVGDRGGGGQSRFRLGFLPKSAQNNTKPIPTRCDKSKFDCKNIRPRYISEGTATATPNVRKKKKTEQPPPRAAKKGVSVF